MNRFLLLMSLYLLGSARGTSSQPNELSGSIDHQTSVQQLPGEQPSGEQPSGEHLSGEQPLSELESGEQPSDEQPSGEHGSGEQPSGEQASGEQPSGEHASGEQASGAPISSTSTGGKLQFMVQGCENMCPSMNLFSHGTRMQIICCRNQSFCNKI
ncbi:acrosomal vesicle protein 1, isoform CRA_c [Homo sapiens]|uniref:Isoform 8 of Acrosomal protein SP-10 n=1 Tax=Homo sapiens TaxID=9606 RepID=P26436-8|nr:intraacrosomal protein SP-10 {alternatively spliced, deletion within exons 2 and 3, variant SP10-8} [human, testis, Peptide, 155 aa] [Homo sapiens]EAW67650.1 acrosomal vesicle protein 1, isoform CRA_c [Homo sapiens]